MSGRSRSGLLAELRSDDRWQAGGLIGRLDVQPHAAAQESRGELPLAVARDDDERERPAQHGRRADRGPVIADPR